MGLHMSKDRFEIFKKILRITEKHNYEVPYDEHYQYFYDYLRLSQSYRLADRYRKGIVKAKDQKYPKDFKTVLETYDAFGDVTKISIEKWWAEKALPQFGIRTKPKGSLLMTLNAKELATDAKLMKAASNLKSYLDNDRPAQNDRAIIVFALPVYANRVVMTYEFDRLLNESGIPLRDPKEIYPYRLLNNKIRGSLLDAAFRVTVHRAAHPTKKLLDIGMETNVSPATYNQNSKEWEFEKRRDLENMTSRLLRKAYRLSEHAARGIFPSLDPIQGEKTTFDWDILAQQYQEYLNDH